jgi:pimeloyl-ACP methyl ester carboxylesterase
MKLSLIISFFFISIVCSAQSTDVSIPYKGFQYQVKGTFLKAEKPNGTAVLIIAGSGPTDRNCNGLGGESNAYKFLAEHLASKGISSLRYDKLGVGESLPGIPEKQMLFYDNVAVAHAVYDFLSQQDGIEKIVIAGHSEGSLVGMILSEEVKAHKFISIAGGAFPASDILSTQFKNIPDPEFSQEAIRVLNLLKEGKKIDKMDKRLYSIFRPSIQPYIKSWFAYDPRIEVSQLKMPVLILQGDNDVQVETKNAEELAMANKKAKKVIVTDVTHVLKKGPRDREGNIDSYSSANVDIDDGIKKAITDFILE